MVPNSFTLNHFSIVSTHKAELEKCLDKIFPPLSIKVDPSYYDLSGPNFETRGGFSDNVLFTRTSCGSFSDDLELSKTDLIFSPEHNAGTGHRRLDDFCRDSPAITQSVSKLNSIYSPAHVKGHLLDHQNVCKTLEGTTAQNKCPSSVNTPQKGSWKRKVALKERLSSNSKSKNGNKDMPSRDTEIFSPKCKISIQKNFSLTKTLSEKPPKNNDPAEKSKGKISSLFSNDYLARLTEEPTLEAEGSNSPGKLFKATLQEEKMNEIKTPTSIKKASTFKNPPKRLGNRPSNSITLIKDKNSEERQSAPIESVYSSKPGAKSQLQVESSGKINLYKEPVGSQTPQGWRDKSSNISNRKKNNVQSKSMQCHFEKKLQGDKNFTPLFQ
jgi:hypothetical protein